MKRFPIAAIVALVVLFDATSGTHASTPTPSPTTVPPKPAMLEVTYADATFSWPEVHGAANYSLSGSVRVGRINTADPFCTPPIEPDGRQILIDVTLPSTALSYAVPLPTLPPDDAWFTATMQIVIRATDDGGTVLAVGGRGLVAETQCANPPAVPLPDDEKVARCVLDPNARESTSDAARAHGQRTFDGSNGGTRIYVGSGGSWSCISLSGIPPLPEFAPDVIESSRDVAGDPPPSSSIQLPRTGSGATRRDADMRRIALAALCAAAAATACAAAVLRARRA